MPIISFFFVKDKKAGLWVIFFYFVYGFLSDAVINSIVNGIHPFLGWRMFTVIEFIVLSVYFHKIISNKIIKKIIPVIATVFVLFCLYDLFTSKSSYFDSVPVAVEAILILGYCVIFLFQQLKSPDSLFLYSTPTFWVIVAFLIYFAGTFFVFIYAQNYYGNEHFDRNYTLINSTFLLLRNIFISIAFFVRPRKQDYKFIPSK